MDMNIINVASVPCPNPHGDVSLAAANRLAEQLADLIWNQALNRECPHGHSRRGQVRIVVNPDCRQQVRAFGFCCPDFENSIV
jgi:hypothetical protein